MYATILTALVLAQPPQPPGQPPRPGQPDRPGQPGLSDRAPADRATSLDGNWTVLFCSKDGQTKADLKDKTVTIRNNVATFTGAEADKMKAMRFELGANGRITVTEMNGADRPAPGARPAGAPPGADPARPAPGSPTANETKTGVFVHGGEFLSVAIHGQRAGAALGARPVPPAGTPPGTRPATPRDTTLGADRMAEKAEFVIVLKRAGNGRAPGDTPDRK